MPSLRQAHPMFANAIFIRVRQNTNLERTEAVKDSQTQKALSLFNTVITAPFLLYAVQFDKPFRACVRMLASVR